MSNPTASSFPFPADTPENSTAAPDSLQMHPSIADPLTSQYDARAKLFEYIEVFYNRQRLHSTLNYKSPAAYESEHQTA